LWPDETGVFWAVDPSVPSVSVTCETSPCSTRAPGTYAASVLACASWPDGYSIVVVCCRGGELWSTEDVKPALSSTPDAEVAAPFSEPAFRTATDTVDGSTVLALLYASLSVPPEISDLTNCLTRFGRKLMSIRKGFENTFWKSAGY